MDEADRMKEEQPAAAALEAEQSPSLLNVDTVSEPAAPEIPQVQKDEKIAEPEKSDSQDEIDRALEESSDSNSSDSSSDDEASESEGESDSGESDVFEDAPRTANELEPEVPCLPEDFEITEKTKIELAGTVFSVGPAQIVVQALSSGEYKILDEGTVFCTADRKLLGPLYETIGPIEKPFYVVRVKTEQDLREVHTKGEEIFYIATSKFAFTEQYRIKGTDASNIHDEEVPVEEQEFSDDEQEALAKGKKRRKRTKSGRDKKPRADAKPGPLLPPPQVSAPQMQRPQVPAQMPMQMPVQMPMQYPMQMPMQVPMMASAQQAQAQIQHLQQQLQLQQLQFHAQWAMMQQMQQQPQQQQPQQQPQPQPLRSHPEDEEPHHKWP